MDIPDTFTPEDDDLFQDERFQSWIVSLLLEDAQKIDPRVEGVLDKNDEQESKLPSQ